MEVHLPHDVIFNHILPRVPAESVVRFKWVSKEWHSFLTSDTFKNKHNRHVDDQKNNLKFLFLSRTGKPSEFATIDGEVPRMCKGITPTRRRLPHFGGTTPGHIRILTSFHGLVCLGIIKDMYDYEYLYSDLIIWNPLTSEHKTLSKSNSHIMACNMLYLKFGLYRSCYEDDYKLLCVDYLDGDVYIYSLKSDSWKKVDVFQRTCIHNPGFWSPDIYLNENLYFLEENSEGRFSSIIRFDTKAERLSKIKSRNVGANPDANHYFATILVKSDCIHVCEKYDIEISGFKRTSIKLWKLDKYENLKKVVTYQLQQDDYIISYLRPFHFMKNGNWLMFNHCSEERCIYEVDSTEKKHIKDKNGKDKSGKHKGNIYDSCIYEVDLKEKEHIEDKSGKHKSGKHKSGKHKGNIYDDYEFYGSIRVDNIRLNHVGYTETFVSPNQHVK